MWAAVCGGALWAGWGGARVCRWGQGGGWVRGKAGCAVEVAAAAGRVGAVCGVQEEVAAVAEEAGSVVVWKVGAGGGGRRAQARHGGNSLSASTPRNCSEHSHLHAMPTAIPHSQVAD